jgi:hypothetical protein
MLNSGISAAVAALCPAPAAALYPPFDTAKPAFMCFNLPDEVESHCLI